MNLDPKKDILGNPGANFSSNSVVPLPAGHNLGANPDDPVQFKQQVTDICELHQKALELLTQGIHLVSTDEMSGIQDERKVTSDLTNATQTGRAYRV